MQDAQYDFLHGQTDRSDFFSPAMQQFCGINMAFTAMGKELYLEKLANAILNHGDVE